MLGECTFIRVAHFYQWRMESGKILFLDPSLSSKLTQILKRLGFLLIFSKKLELHILDWFEVLKKISLSFQIRFDRYLSRVTQSLNDRYHGIQLCHWKNGFDFAVGSLFAAEMAAFC